MCVDLASTHLKAYFTQIHYFGRARPFFGINDEIREMLAAMRKKKGGRVTWNDIKQYLEADALVTLRPFIPRNIHLWRYVDETSSQLSTARQNSVASELASTRRPSQLRTDQQLSARNSLSPMVDNNNSSRRWPMQIRWEEINNSGVELIGQKSESNMTFSAIFLLFFC